MKPYAECKPTEYQWLGSIPTHWEWLFLSQTCRERDVKNKAEEENNVLSLSYGRIIRKKDINAGLVPKDYNTYQIVENGNIILRLTDLQNDQKSLRTGLVREKGIITSAYTCLAPFQNSEYLQLLLHAYDVQKYFYGLGGGVRQSIGFKDIRYTLVPFPPRDEQDQIVRWLDWRTSRINKLVRSKRREIECLKELKKSVVNEAVTKGGDGWNTISLRKLLQRVTVKGYPELPLLSVVRERGVIPRDMDKSENHNVIPDNLSGYLVLKEGQFVINKMKAWQGSCGVSPYTGLVSPAYFVFELRFGNKEFFHYAIRSQRYVDKFARRSKGIRVGQWDLPVQELNNIEFLFPSEEEQARIAAFLNEKLEAIDRLIEKLKDEIHLILEYKTRIISDGVTGKIDLRNVGIPNYEAVEEESGIEDEDEEMEEGTGDEDN